MRNLLIPAAAAALLIGSAPAQAGSCGAHASSTESAGYGHKALPNIVETAVAAGDFGTLATALTEAGLVDALSGEGPFTVFAPTDAAFAKLPEGTVAELLKPENRERLTAILTYHVVEGKLGASEVTKSTGAESLNGQRLEFAAGQSVTVDGARVVKADIEAGNGIIHVIDTVLLPSEDDLVATAKSAGQFGTLLAALEATSLDGVLSGEGPFTVFAPTDAAFAKLPAGTVESLLQPENRGKLESILKYHVVAGRVNSTQAASASEAQTVEGSNVRFLSEAKGLRVNDALVVASDVDAANGVIHVVDSVLLPN